MSMLDLILININIMDMKQNILIYFFHIDVEELGKNLR
jgi:hypothetical protein